MAEKTATSLFPDYDTAVAAVSRLEAAGIAGQDISLVANRVNDRYWGQTNRPDGSTGTATDAIAYWLISEGVNKPDAEAYAEGVRRGGAIVVVRCSDADADRISTVLERAHWRTRE